MSRYKAIFIKVLSGVYSGLPFVAGLSVGLLFFTFHIIGYGFDFFPGDRGDGHFNLYILEHAHRFFSGDIKDLWNAPYMFPEPNIIAYSDNLLGSAPIYSLFRLLGLDQFNAYQCWVLILSILNYSFAYLFINKLVTNKYAAVIGAMVFAFSIAIQSQVTHVQTFPRFPIPLAFLMAVSFFNTLKPKYFFLTILSLVYQIYCGIYLGFLLAIPLGIFLIITLIVKGKSIREILSLNWFFKVIVGIIVNVVILIPLMLPYLSRGSHTSWEKYNSILHSVPTIRSFFFSKNGSLFWDFLDTLANDIPAAWDHQVFMGGVATLSVLVCLIILIKRIIIRKKSLFGHKYLLPLMLSGIITFVLYFRINNDSLYFLVYFLPGYSAIKATTRIINIELLYAALATSFMVLLVLRNIRKYKIPIFIAFIILFVVDNYINPKRVYRSPVSESREEILPLSETFNMIPDGAVISYEPQNKDRKTIYYNIEAMLASQYSNNKVLNGYTSTCPGAYIDYWNNLNEASRNKWLRSIEFDGVDTIYIVTGKKEYHPVSVSIIK